VKIHVHPSISHAHSSCMSPLLAAAAAQAKNTPEGVSTDANAQALWEDVLARLIAHERRMHSTGMRRAAAQRPASSAASADPAVWTPLPAAPKTRARARASCSATSVKQQDDEAIADEVLDALVIQVAIEDSQHVVSQHAALETTLPPQQTDLPTMRYQTVDATTIAAAAAAVVPSLQDSLQASQKKPLFLERMRQEAAAAARSPRRAPRARTTTTAVADDGGRSLAAVLAGAAPSRLQLMKEAAEAARRERIVASKAVSRVIPGTGTNSHGGLGEGFVRKLSKLEREKAAAKAAENAAATAPALSSTVAQAVQVGLEQTLRKPAPSRLQREAAAARAGVARPNATGRKLPQKAAWVDVDVAVDVAVDMAVAADVPAAVVAAPKPVAAEGLGTGIKRRSKVEREKSAWVDVELPTENKSTTNNTTDSASATSSAAPAATGGFQGGLGEGFIRKMSKLEREKAAWAAKEAAAAAAPKAMVMNSPAPKVISTALGEGVRKMSRLEREQAAVVAAREARAG
jgi:hypothetical protein